jgi:hypothetical protein
MVAHTTSRRWAFDEETPAGWLANHADAYSTTDAGPMSKKDAEQPDPEEFVPVVEPILDALPVFESHEG